MKIASACKLTAVLIGLASVGYAHAYNYDSSAGEQREIEIYVDQSRAAWQLTRDQREPACREAAKHWRAGTALTIRRMTLDPEDKVNAYLDSQGKTEKAFNDCMNGAMNNS